MTAAAVGVCTSNLGTHNVRAVHFGLQGRWCSRTSTGNMRIGEHHRAGSEVFKESDTFCSATQG
jgi:hypothetical protein